MGATVKSPSWKDFLELIGITAIVASLIFVGLQLQQSQAIAGSELAAKLLTDDMEWINLVNQNRDVWIRGNRGDNLNEVETSAYRDLLGINVSRSFLRYRQLQNIGLGGEMLVAQFVTFLHLNPGARVEWQRRAEHKKKYYLPLVENRIPDIVESDYDYDLLVITMLRELDEMSGPN